jgi:hypothetical protein
LTLAAGAAFADPGKNESGKGRWREDYGWGDQERKFKFRTPELRIHAQRRRRVAVGGPEVDDNLTPRCDRWHLPLGTGRIR